MFQTLGLCRDSASCLLEACVRYDEGKLVMSGGEDLPDELPLSDDEELEDLFGDFDDFAAALFDESQLVQPTPVNIDDAPSGGGQIVVAQERPCTPTPIAGLIRLTPATAARGSKGRGRGRPRKAPISLTSSSAQSSTALVPKGAAAKATIASVRGCSSGDSQDTTVCWLPDSGASQEPLTQVKNCPCVQPTQRRVLAGFVEPPAHVESLAAAVVVGSRLGEEADKDCAAVLRFLLSQTKGSVISLEAMSAVTQVERRKCAKLAIRGAAVLASLTQVRRLRLEQTMCSMARRCLIHYAEVVQYDETPLPTKVTGDASQLVVHVVAGGLPSAGNPPGQPSSGVVCRLGSSKALSVRASHAQQKIVQTRQDVGMVIKVGERLVIVSFHSLCPLSVLERTTAAALKHGQLLMSQASRGARCFELVTRAATTDAYSANIAAEASIAEERQSPCHSLHWTCTIHATAGVYGKTFAPLDEHISGVIRVALSMRSGAAMSRFRKCLREEIGSRLQIKAGKPPPEALSYKMTILRLFVRHGAAVTTRATLLALCPNGEWRSPKVEFYLHGGGHPDLDEPGAILQHMTDGLIVALASAQPALYNRSRWTGSDIAVDDLGVFEAVHRLLSTTYCRFAASFAGGALRKNLLALRLSMTNYDEDAPLELVDNASDQCDDQPMGEEAGASAVDDSERGTDPHGTSQQGGTADWARQNATDRRIALGFLRLKPLGHLILLRMLMEPLRQLLSAQFEQASDKWEAKQRAQAAKALNEGKAASRKYRVVELAEGTLGQTFYEQLQLLFEAPVLWAAMPPSTHIVSMRAMAFKCAGRMGAAFHKLLAAKHRHMPYQLFRILVNPSLSAEFAQLPSCMLDEWTRAMKAKFPTFSGDEFLASLHMIAVMMPVDISRIESLHASIRRCLTVRSTHTHPLTLEELSALWLCQQFRAAHKSSTKGDTAKGVGKTNRQTKRGNPKMQKKTAASGQAPRRCGGGGAWRAWVRKYAGKRRIDQVDMTDLGEQYQAAKRRRAEEFVDAERLGRAATAVARETGGRAFGGSAWQRLRSRKMLMGHLACLATPSSRDTTTNTAMTVAARSIASGATISQSLSAARHHRTELARQEIARERELLSELSKFEGGVGAHAVELVRRMVPRLASWPLRPTPTLVGVHVQVEMPTNEEVLAALSCVIEQAHASALATTLDNHWAAQHQTVMHDACSSVPPAPKVSECLAAGVCLCSPAGQNIKRRAEKFVKYLKQVCPFNSNLRQSLCDGDLVVRLVGHIGGEQGAEALEGASHDFWVHIALMYLSPYEPTFMFVKPTDDPKELEPDTKRVYVTSLHKFAGLYEGFVQLGSSEHISAQFFKIEATARPIAAFLPQPVPVIELPGFAAPVRFFPRLRGHRGAGKQSRPADARDESDDEDVQAAAAPEEAEGLPLEDIQGSVTGATLDLLDPVFDVYTEATGAALVAAVTIGSDVVSPTVLGDNVGEDLLPPHEASASGAGPSGLSRSSPQTDQNPMVVLEHGVVQYYTSNGNFQATCWAHSNERCTLTRKGDVAGKHNRGTRSIGRPLGFMVAWLSCGVGCDHKAEHRSSEHLQRLGGPDERAFRLQCRQALADLPNGPALLAKERPAVEGEGDEPDSVA